VKAGEVKAGSAMTRRAFVQKSAVGVASTAFAGRFADGALAAPRRRRIVPLPSAAQYRADVQRMVDFGPRLPGSAAHNAYCDWLEDQFVNAGLELLPADQFAYDRWDLGAYSLDVLDGPSPGTLKVAFPYVRSAGTPAGGIVAPLSYGSMEAGGAPGSIVVVDVPAPAKLTGAAFLPLFTYRYWPGHNDADWAMIDYQRAWVGPWPSSFSSFAAAGAKAVVLIAANGTYEALKGTFSPHQASAQPIPVLIVDSATGTTLRQQALAGRNARLKLDAPLRRSTFRTITAVLPGASQETIIVDTHSDGQNAVEENAGPAIVGMARHFGSLPPRQRPKRTLAFVVWSAHMTDPAVQPEADGWIKAHPEIVNRAVAAVTLEHLGCLEWIDDPSKGYHGTGQNELYGIWTTQGPTFELAKSALIKHNLVRHALARGPVEFTVGGIFQQIGVPNVGGIAGPEYLLVISDRGEIEKLDFDLGARQIGFYADMIKAFDSADANALKTGDPTLGQPTNAEVTPGGVKSKPVTSGPADRFVTDDGHGNRLEIHFDGARDHYRAVLLTVTALDLPLRGITVELYRGDHRYARSAPFTATGKHRHAYLRRRTKQSFPPGTYSLIIRQRGRPLVRHSVQVGPSRR
jgi:hypothetical protein